MLALAACSKSKPEPAATIASCHASASQTCEDYDGGKPYLESRGKDCQQIGGTWSTSACPTANVMGSCREKTASWTRTRHYYAGAGVDLARTKIECGAFGAWLEPAPPP